MEFETLGPAEIIAQSIPRERTLVGVYFLIQDGEVVYVGQSRNIPVRIAQHARGQIPFDRYALQPCPVALLGNVEQHYINLLHPKHNVRLGDGSMPCLLLEAVGAGNET